MSLSRFRGLFGFSLFFLVYSLFVCVVFVFCVGAVLSVCLFVVVVVVVVGLFTKSKEPRACICIWSTSIETLKYW
jgi:hypothetical protein